MKISEDTSGSQSEPSPELMSDADKWIIGPLHFYDILPLFLVIVFTVGLFFVGPPLILDDFYHMGVAQTIHMVGFVPTWDFWNFLPVGRPHLYPPLLHVFMALFMKFSGGDVFFATRVFKVITYPFLIFCFWYSARGFLGRKPALYSTMALASIYPMFVLSYVIMPASLVLALTCLLFLTFTRKKFLYSIILMTVMLWLHISMSIFTIVALLAFSLLRRKEGYLKFFFKVFTASTLFYSPWLIHVAVNMDWLASAGLPIELFIPFIVWAAGLPSFILLFRYYKADYSVYMLYAFSLIPMFFGYGIRFWVYLSIPLSFFVGLTLSRNFSKSGKWRAVKMILVILLIVSVFLVSPAIGGMTPVKQGPINYPDNSFSLLPSPFLQLFLWPPLQRSMITLDILPFYLASGWIKTNTQALQPICYIGFSLTGASIINAFTGRPTTGGMWLEVMNPLTLIVSQLYILSYGTVYIVEFPFTSPPPSIPCKLAADYGVIKIFVRT